MTKQRRTLAGFGDIVQDGKINNDTNNESNNNNDNNINDNIKKDSVIDSIVGVKEPKSTFVGIYFEPVVARVLDELAKKGGKGAKSKIVNEVLKHYFRENGYMRKTE